MTDFNVQVEAWCPMSVAWELDDMLGFLGEIHRGNATDGKWWSLNRHCWWILIFQMVMLTPVRQLFRKIVIDHHSRKSINVWWRSVMGDMDWQIDSQRINLLSQHFMKLLLLWLRRVIDENKDQEAVINTQRLGVWQVILGNLWNLSPFCSHYP